MIDGTKMGVTQETNDVGRKELAVEQQKRVGVALFLMKQFLKLAQDFTEIGAETLAPGADARIGIREQAHEDVRTANALPAGFLCEPDRFAENGGGGFGDEVGVKLTPRQENIILTGFRRRHNAILTGKGSEGSFSGGYSGIIE